MKKEMQRIRRSRKAAALAVALSAAVLMTACGSKEYLKDIKASNYVTLGNYIGITASAPGPVVVDSMVNAYLARYIMPTAPTEEVKGRAVEEYDVANIDFVGYLDGEAFEGGTGSNYDLLIGAHMFIDGFEEGLIGVNIGETVSLDLTFPDPYTSNPDLSGVPVVFEVTVNSISEPLLTDEYVQSLGIEGCSTEQELRDWLYNSLYDNAVQNYNDTIETVLTNTIMSDCTFKEPPAQLVERFAQSIEEVFSAQAAAYGMTLTSYMLNYYGVDEATYKEQFKQEALTGAQQYIMYQAIADTEGLNPTDEQMQEEIHNRAVAYGYESDEAYRESVDMEMLKEQVMRSNVMEFLKENGNIITTQATEE